MMGTMKTSSRALATIVLLFCPTGASVGTADIGSVVLARVPRNGIRPEAVVDGRGILHLLYFAGEPRAGDLFDDAP
jgi:hypothetical protein